MTKSIRLHEETSSTSRVQSVVSNAMDLMTSHQPVFQVVPAARTCATNLLTYLAHNVIVTGTRKSTGKPAPLTSEFAPKHPCTAQRFAARRPTGTPIFCRSARTRKIFDRMDAPTERLLNHRHQKRIPRQTPTHKYSCLPPAFDTTRHIIGAELVSHRLAQICTAWKWRGECATFDVTNSGSSNTEHHSSSFAEAARGDPQQSMLYQNSCCAIRTRSDTRVSDNVVAVHSFMKRRRAAGHRIFFAFSLRYQRMADPNMKAISMQDGMRKPSRIMRGHRICYTGRHPRSKSDKYSAGILLWRMWRWTGDSMGAHDPAPSTWIWLAICKPYAAARLN